MPPGKKYESALPVSGDRISDLPDHVLHHLLSFLPAQAVVQTCVLARRWRHLWRSVTRLRIGGIGTFEPEGPLFVPEEHRKFVDHLLMLRERTDLDSVDIEFDGIEDDDQSFVNLWIRFAVLCNVRALTVSFIQYHLYLDNLPLVSRYLKKLHFCGVDLHKSSLDFASCPALEDLQMRCCHIYSDRISSCSMKHLEIAHCSTADPNCRLLISTPSLVSLNLKCFEGLTPLLGNMALLETASVVISNFSADFCLRYDSAGVFCGAHSNTCQNCVSVRKTVLLGNISSAKHLGLMSNSGKFIFSRDLKHCPTFSNLKTLLLNEYWCEAPDLDPLACILKNSPVLEKLTLQLFCEELIPEVEMKGSYSSVERSSAISKHLKIVEVKCTVVDETILKILDFLCAFNIRFSFHTRKGN